MCLCGSIQTIPAPFNHESITVSTSAVGLTATAYKPTDTAQGDPMPAIMAFITNYGDVVRYWFDGATPTSTVGHVLANGDSITLCQASLPLFKAIRISTASGDSVLSVTYLRAS